MKKALFSILALVILVGISTTIGASKAEAYSFYSSADPVTGYTWFSDGGYASTDPVSGYTWYNTPEFNGYSSTDSVSGYTWYNIQPNYDYHNYSYSSSYDWDY